MPSYMSIPQPKLVITHSAVDYTLSQYMMDAKITRRENGVDVATILLADTLSNLYDGKLDEDDDVEISIKDQSAAAYTTLFDGVASMALPSLTPLDVVTLKCDGAGYPLMRMNCGEQYGTESVNPTLDTLSEILTDATNGVVPAWVNKLGIDAGVSGYSLTTEVEAIAGSIRYLYFPYQPADKTISNVCEIVQALKGTNPGPHWMVTTGGKLLVSTIGTHHAAAVTEGWTNYYGGSQALSTVEQGIDFKTFHCQHLAKEANYILYHGKFRKPGSGDVWTNGNAANWDTSVVNAAWQCTMSDESGAGLFVVGSNSLEAYGDTNGQSFDFMYPSSKDATWDLTKIGGEHNIPSINFYMQCDANVDRTGNYPEIVLAKYTEPGGVPVLDGQATYLGPSLPTDDRWYHFNFPIGPYWKSANKDWEGWHPRNTPGWIDIDGVYFRADSKAGVRGKVYIDGLQINGYVLRGAREAVYSAGNPCKMKVVTDDEGKDDTIVASDDTGTMAQLAYAEYLRSSSTPRVGNFMIPLLKDLWPGMFMHVHAKKKADGTFTVDDDFRVTKLMHHITADTKGCATTVQVTDDVKNANARASYNDLNRVLRAVRPEFQDRQATSVKMREIDITQAVLEKNY